MPVIERCKQIIADGKLLAIERALDLQAPYGLYLYVAAAKECLVNKGIAIGSHFSQVVGNWHKGIGGGGPYGLDVESRGCNRLVGFPEGGIAIRVVLVIDGLPGRSLINTQVVRAGPVGLMGLFLDKAEVKACFQIFANFCLYLRTLSYDWLTGGNLIKQVRLSFNANQSAALQGAALYFIILLY